MNIYVVREKIPYEGDNIWIVSATGPDDARNLTEASKLTDVSVEWILIGYHKESEVIWTNT